MTMLTQAEKRRMRGAALQPVMVDPPPPVPEVKITPIYANVQRDNIVSKIAFGEMARNLLPHLASIWDNGK